MVLLTPQPKKMTSSIYRQTMDIADLVTEALARNTIQVEGVGHSVGVASPHDESQPLDLKGASLLLGCSRVQVHFHAACHGSIALRSLLSADRRVWDTKVRIAQPLQIVKQSAHMDLEGEAVGSMWICRATMKERQRRPWQSFNAFCERHYSSGNQQRFSSPCSQGRGNNLD